MCLLGRVLSGNSKTIRDCQTPIIRIIENKNKLYPTLRLFEEATVLQIRQLYIKAALMFLLKKTLRIRTFFLLFLSLVIFMF